MPSVRFLPTQLIVTNRAKRIYNVPKDLVESIERPVKRAKFSFIEALKRGFRKLPETQQYVIIDSPTGLRGDVTIRVDRRINDTFFRGAEVPLGKNLSDVHKDVEQGIRQSKLEGQYPRIVKAKLKKLLNVFHASKDRHVEVNVTDNAFYNLIGQDTRYANELNKFLKRVKRGTYKPETSQIIHIDSKNPASGEFDGLKSLFLRADKIENHDIIRGIPVGMTHLDGKIKLSNVQDTIKMSQP